MSSAKISKKKVSDLEKELAEAKKVIGMYITYEILLTDVLQVASKRRLGNSPQTRAISSPSPLARPVGDLASSCVLQWVLESHIITGSWCIHSNMRIYTHLH